MTTKSRRRLRVRTVKNRIINNKKIKGVKYTIEPLEAKTHLRSINGDIFKKYIDGVLVKQVFVSKNKLIGLIRNLKKTFRMNAGGKIYEGTTYDGQQQQVEISDKTTFGQNVKSGFGAGLGVGFAFHIVELIFSSIFGDS